MASSTSSSKTQKKRRKSVKGTSNSVKVAVRVRPFNSREKKLDPDASPIIDIDSEKHLTLSEPSSADRTIPFSFDHCFGEDSTQEQVFETLGRQVVVDALAGYNVCVFAYGQTGSGKSHTMIGGNSPETEGLVPRIAKELFQSIDNILSKDPEMSFEVNTSMIEIYNEQIRDLRVINKKKKDYKPLQLRQHPVMGVYVQDVKWIIVENHEQLQKEFDMANKSKTVHNTMMNKSSSRAHTVFELKLTQQKTHTVKGKQFTEKKISKINLVDLAGSERSKKTKVETGGQRFKEGVNINLSLTTLGRVIKALSEGQKPPYRDSVLTLLLKSSLGGNSRTLMVSTLSPHPNNFSETKSTLDYSKRAKKIVNRAKVNEDANILKDLKKEIDALKKQLHDEQKNKEKARELEEQLSQSKTIIEELKQSIAATREEKLRETQHIQKAREEALRETGLSVNSVESMLGVDIRTLPCLVNLDEDNLQSGCLFYYLRKGKTTLGKGDTCNIHLLGIGVKEHHCDFQYDPESHKVILHPMDQAKVLVNGRPVGNAPFSASTPQTSQTDKDFDPSTADTSSAPEKIELHSSDRVIIGDQWYFRFQNPHEKSRKTKEIIDWEYAQRERFKEEKLRFKQKQEAKLAELEKQRKLVEEDMKKIDETKAKFKAEEERISQNKKKQKQLEESVKEYERLIDEEKTRSEQIQQQLLQASKEREEAEQRVREEHERLLADEQSKTEQEKQKLLEQKDLMEQQLKKKQKAEEDLKSKYDSISAHVNKVKEEIEKHQQEKKTLEEQLQQQATLVAELQEKEKKREEELKAAEETLAQEKELTRKKLAESEKKSEKLSETIEKTKKEADEAKDQIEKARDERDKMQTLFEEKLKEQERMKEEYEKMLQEKDRRMKEINDNLQKEKERLEESNQKMKEEMEERQRQIAELESKHQALLSDREATQKQIEEEIEAKKKIVAEQKRLFSKEKEATEKEKEELSKMQKDLEQQLASKSQVENDLRRKLDKIEEESKHSKNLVEEQRNLSQQLKDELSKEAKKREELLKEHHQELLRKEIERSDNIQQQLDEAKEQKKKETEEFRQALKAREETEKQLESQYEELLSRSEETRKQLEEESAQKENLQNQLEEQQKDFDAMIEKQRAEHQESLKKLETEKSKILEQLQQQQDKEKSLADELEAARRRAQDAQSKMTEQEEERQQLLSQLDENQTKQLSLSEKVEEMELQLRDQEKREAYLREEYKKRLEEEQEKTRKVQQRLMDSKQTEEHELQALVAAMKEKLRKSEARNSEYKQLIERLNADVESHEMEKEKIRTHNEQLRTERDTLNYRLVANLDSMQHELSHQLKEAKKMRDQNLELRKQLRELQREVEFERQMPLQIRMRFNLDTYIQNVKTKAYFSVDSNSTASPGNANYLMMNGGKFFRSSSQLMVFTADGHISPRLHPNYVLTVTEFVENAPIQLLPRVHGDEKGSRLTRNHQRWFFFETKSGGSKDRTLILASMAHLEFVISSFSKGKPAVLEKFNPSKLEQRWILKSR